MAHAKLMIPRITNELRQVTKAINQTIRGGVTALPSRAQEWVMPWAKARLPGGVQSLMARVAAGKVGPSPKPSMTRAKNIITRQVTRPVRDVAKAQITAEIVSARRAPKRSLTQPPMI